MIIVAEQGSAVHYSTVGTLFDDVDDYFAEQGLAVHYSTVGTLFDDVVIISPNRVRQYAMVPSNPVR